MKSSKVDFLRRCLQMINATMTINPTMIENGSADISLYAFLQKHPREEKVAFTHPFDVAYLGYFIKENTEIKVGDYLSDAFDPTVSSCNLAK
ncbi:unnamed protein product [Cylicocyclus nassatus]|uniref:Uncharacterized protein n=1 Tax=Cylicocyclus nassatus TaxID=53992 RepID=A0AA36HCG7_CYLNA|nr:unnamed protein product [Cylicocyclus nassatus]